MWGGIFFLRVKIRVEENIEEMYYLLVICEKIIVLMIIGFLV